MAGSLASGRAVRRAALLLAAACGLPALPARGDDAPALPEVPSGKGATASAAQDPAARRRFARALFFDLRGRGPTPAEMQEALARDAEDLVDRMLSDTKTWEAWLDRELYFYLLIDRFRPTSDRVKALPARLALGACTAREATREIVVSVEFNTRNPGNDTFVTVVLEQLLGMVVQQKPKVLAAGKTLYDGKQERFLGQVGRNQADIVRIVLEQREFSDRFVERQWRQVFGSPVPKEALARDGARLHADPAAFPALLREWLLSDAYRARTAIPRPKNDLVFIRTLFVDLLGREPSFEEFRNSRNALTALSDPAPVRGVLAQLLLDSGKAPLPEKATLDRPADWVRSKFVDLLGREPTRTETETFVATLGEYGCEPKTIVLAIATSAEYQYY